MSAGLFKQGYQFDAILVDAGTRASNLQINADDMHNDVLQKILYNAGRANIAKVWVAGKLVHDLLAAACLMARPPHAITIR